MAEPQDPTEDPYWGRPQLPGGGPAQTEPATEYSEDDTEHYVPPIARQDPRDLTTADALADVDEFEVPGAHTEEERRIATGRPTADVAGPPDVGRALGGVDVMGEFRQGQQRMRELGERARAETEPLYDEAIAAMRQPRPDPPQLLRQPIPPDRSFNMNDYVVQAMMAAVFGSLISRQHVTGALNSFAGYMEGARQGNLDQAKIKLDDWKAQSEAVVTENKTMMDQYNAILKNQNMDITQKMNAVRLTAEKWQDQMRIQAAENKNVTEMARSLEALRYHNALLESKNAQIQVQRDRLSAMQEGSGNSPMSEKAKNVIADMFMETGKLPPNIWRGKSGAADARAVMELVAEKADAQGVTGADLARIMQRFSAESAALSGAARTAGGQAAKVGAAVAETETTIPQARIAMKNLAKAIGLGDYPAVNAGKMFKAHQTGSEELRMAHTANEAVITAYGAVMGRGQPQLTNLARTRADALLQINEGPKVYEAGLRQLQIEMDAAKDAPEEAIRRLLERATTRKKPGETEKTKDPAGIME
jgi:hypothetical protein